MSKQMRAVTFDFAPNEQSESRSTGKFMVFKQMHTHLHYGVPVKRNTQYYNNLMSFYLCCHKEFTLSLSNGNACVCVRGSNKFNEWLRLFHCLWFLATCAAIAVVCACFEQSNTVNGKHKHIQHMPSVARDICHCGRTVWNVQLNGFTQVKE